MFFYQAFLSHLYRSVLQCGLLFVVLILNLGLVPFAQATTNCNIVTEISKIECESLLQLYHSTNGHHWINNDGWNMTNMPCNWYGVTCENGKVTKINLGGNTSNNIKGMIPILLH